MCQLCGGDGSRVFGRGKREEGRSISRSVGQSIVSCGAVLCCAVSGGVGGISLQWMRWKSEVGGGVFC